MCLVLCDSFRREYGHEVGTIFIGGETCTENLCTCGKNLRKFVRSLRQFLRKLSHIFVNFCLERNNCNQIVTFQGVFGPVASDIGG